MSFVSRYLEPALVEQLNHLQLSARRVVEGSVTGQHRSPVKGASVEFRQHRFYTPGDEPRRLDWRVLARTDRPYIKEYNEETNLRCVLMLDCSGSMAYGAETAQKFDYASRLAAALAYLMLGQTESVGLATCTNRLERWLAPKAGTAQLSRLIDLLERATPYGKANLAGVMQKVADRLERRTLVILVTDGFCPIANLREGLVRFRHDRHETICLQVLHRDEMEFPFRTWARFRGMENERPEIFEPALMRKVYLENFASHQAQLHDACRALDVEYHSFVTDRPLIESVTLFLHRR
jgi:uncharacterized protein (DUF58 family)